MVHMALNHAAWSSAGYPAAAGPLSHPLLLSGESNVFKRSFARLSANFENEDRKIEVARRDDIMPRFFFVSWRFGVKQTSDRLRALAPLQGNKKKIKIA